MESVSGSFHSYSLSCPSQAQGAPARGRSGRQGVDGNDGGMHCSCEPACRYRKKSQTNDTPFRGRALNGIATFLYALDARPRNLPCRSGGSRYGYASECSGADPSPTASRARVYECCLGLRFRMARRGWECDFIRMAFPFLSYYGPTLLQSCTISYLFRPAKQVRMSCAQGREQYQVFEKKQRAI